MRNAHLSVQRHVQMTLHDLLCIVVRLSVSNQRHNSRVPHRQSGKNAQGVSASSLEPTRPNYDGLLLCAPFNPPTLTRSSNDADVEFGEINRIAFRSRWHQRELSCSPAQSRTLTPILQCICASAWVLSPPDYTPSESTPLSFPKLSSAPSAAFDSIEHTIDQLSASLRDLSLDIHAHPEIGFQEFRTSKVCVEFMRKLAGWKVTKGVYGLETAWEATFEHGEHGAGQTVGFNSEMVSRNWNEEFSRSRGRAQDSLPGLGHACGHNLICIAGMAAALSVAQTLVKLDIAGQVVLLGTPSEENAGGKIIMIKNGAYKSMDACLMLREQNPLCSPRISADDSATLDPAAVEGLAPMLAISEVEVEYVGANAHATLAWEGINALDAAVLAYNNISALRQQVNPSHRIHGIIQGSEDWVCNSKLEFGPNFRRQSLTYRLLSRSSHVAIDLRLSSTDDRRSGDSQEASREMFRGGSARDGMYAQANGVDHDVQGASQLEFIIRRLQRLHGESPIDADSCDSDVWFD